MPRCRLWVDHPFGMIVDREIVEVRAELDSVAMVLEGQDEAVVGLPWDVAGCGLEDGAILFTELL